MTTCQGKPRLSQNIQPTFTYKYAVVRRFAQKNKPNLPGATYSQLQQYDTERVLFFFFFFTPLLRKILSPYEYFIARKSYAP